MTNLPPVPVFISYAHKDERLKNKLLTHLSTLKKLGIISEWNDRDITAGDDWADQIDKNLKNAKIVLLLISSDFIQSDYCYSIEMKYALRRNKAGRCVVVPVFLRPCHWKGLLFGKIQGLPSDAEPVTGKGWKNQDYAFTEVAEGIQKTVEKHRKEWALTQRTAKTASSLKVIPSEASKRIGLVTPQPPAKPKSTKAVKPPATLHSVKDTGPWVLLNGRFYKSKNVVGHADGSKDVQILPLSSEEEADLLALAPANSFRTATIGFAYQDYAGWMNPETPTTTSGAGRALYTFHLKPADRSSSWQEYGYNGLSADQVAEARARFLLLNERPAISDRWMGSHLATIPTGIQSQQDITKNPFPELWEQANHRAPIFLRQARLWAVFYLLTGGLCQHILELTLGPIKDGMLPVNFRGRRHKAYDNQPAATMEVAGEFPLKGKG